MILQEGGCVEGPYLWVLNGLEMMDWFIHLFFVMLDSMLDMNLAIPKKSQLNPSGKKRTLLPN